MLEAKALSKAFGERLLVEKLDFSIPPGAVVGIIGGNGAGKSTLFRMIMGQESPDSGALASTALASEYLTFLGGSLHYGFCSLN